MTNCPPFRIKGRRGLGRYDFVQRLALPFERGDIAADRDEHVAVFGKLCAIAVRTMAGNDNRCYRASQPNSPPPRESNRPMLPPVEQSMKG